MRTFLLFLLLLVATLAAPATVVAQQRDSLPTGVRVRLRTSDVAGWQAGSLLRVTDDSVELRTAALASPRTIPRRALTGLQVYSPPLPMRERLIFGTAIGTGAAALAFAIPVWGCEMGRAIAGGACTHRINVPLTIFLLAAGATFGAVVHPERLTPVALH